MAVSDGGFTLIELVLVLVIIGLLSAVAVPRAIEISGEQDEAIKQVVSGAVKNAFIIAQADLKTFPSIQSLALYVQADSVKTLDNGVVIAKDGDHYTVPTYVDQSCSTPTTQVSDRVLCVGPAQ